jgi:hypothetical protein
VVELGRSISAKYLDGRHPPFKTSLSAQIQPWWKLWNKPASTRVQS